MYICSYIKNNEKYPTLGHILIKNNKQLEYIFKNY